MINPCISYESNQEPYVISVVPIYHSRRHMLLSHTGNNHIHHLIIWSNLGNQNILIWPQHNKWWLTSKRIHVSTSPRLPTPCSISWISSRSAIHPNPGLSIGTITLGTWPFSIHNFGRLLLRHKNKPMSHK